MSAGYYKKLQIKVEANKMSKRLTASFAKAKQENRGILGIFVSAGDPDTNTSIKILDGLVESGADMIELGMPFSDPMADGPAIQAASLRAIKSGMTLRGSLEIASQFRKKHADTPISEISILRRTLSSKNVAWSISDTIETLRHRILLHGLKVDPKLSV